MGALSFILYEYFSKLNYTFNLYVDNIAKPDIDLKDFKLGFKLTNATGGDFPDIDRFFKISALLWDVHNPELGDDTNFIPTKITVIPEIKCDKYKNGSLFYENFAKYSNNKKDIVCFDFQSLNKTLKGSYGSIGK